jgi:glycosidase
MNYWLRQAVIDFFIEENIGVAVFEERLAELRARVPADALHTLYNLLSSHDTARILSVCGGDTRKLKLAVLFHMTFPGAPAICYGDEVGLAGEHPFSTARRTMPWNPEEWNRDLLDYHKKLLKFRKSHPALKRGDFRVLLKDESQELLVYERTCAGDRVVVALNNGHAAAECRIPGEFEGDLTDLLSGRAFPATAGEVVLSAIPPKTGLCLFSATRVDSAGM